MTFTPPFLDFCPCVEYCSLKNVCDSYDTELKWLGGWMSQLLCTVHLYSTALCIGLGRTKTSHSPLPAAARSQRPLHWSCCLWRRRRRREGRRRKIEADRLHPVSSLTTCLCQLVETAFTQCTSLCTDLNSLHCVALCSWAWAGLLPDLQAGNSHHHLSPPLHRLVAISYKCSIAAA